MAHPIPLPFPCPVKLGRIKGDSLEADLHDYVREGNYVKVKKLLKKGIFVDAVNSMGQTCLFTAALLGLGKIVDVLLEYGSDANHRCYDGSTPVHAAAFSGSPSILSKLLDEGGELRVHDSQGRTPQLWALTGSKESSAQMLEFIQQCTLHMQAALWNLPSDLLRKFGSSKALICSPSRFGGLVQGNAEAPLGKLLKGPSVAKNICSFGFGKVSFHLAGSGHLAYLASLPIIGDRDVVQADDEPAFSYPVGPYMIMTKNGICMGGMEFTLWEWNLPYGNGIYLGRMGFTWGEWDLLREKRDFKLRHPHLLQLMSVCLSCDLQRTRLVYERVHFGSLYSILHERRAEFPVLQTETLLHVLLQILDALRFLHSRGFLHRSLSSLAIQVVSSGEGKLCNLDKDSGEHSDLTRIPVPAQLFRWSSPEIVLGKPGTVKSDVYSFCAVLQEALTESPPWKGVEDSAVKQLMLSGQQLQADVRLPLLYYDVVKSGLEPKQRNRSIKLQDIQYILKNDLKQRCQTLLVAFLNSQFSRIANCWISGGTIPCFQLHFPGGFPAPKDSAFPQESSAVVLQEAAEPPEQDRLCSEVQPAASPCSESDVDESLCSFEMNEILASYPEGPQDFLQGAPGSGQALQDAERQQEQSQGEAEEEEESSASSTGFTGEEEEEEEDEEEEEGVREAPGLSQMRGDAGSRLSSPSQSEQHISKCVLNLKIMQSMLQQAGLSLSRTEQELGRLKAQAKQSRLLQELRMNLLPKGNSKGRHWDGSAAASHNTNQALSGVDIFLHQAVAPPSRDYIPPPVTCQAPGRDGSQAVPKTAKDREAMQNEKWKSKIAATHRDPGCPVGELHCSLNSPPDGTEEFFTPDYFLPPALEGRSEPEVKIPFFGHELHNIGHSNCQNMSQSFSSVADIQDLSSIPCEQNFQRGVECRTPRPSHAPASVSTPLGSGNAGRGKKRIHRELLLLSVPARPFCQHFVIDELPPPAQELLDEIGKSTSPQTVGGFPAVLSQDFSQTIHCQNTLELPN
uniref:Testis expressed 14, intercellular bridge forming factor n=1 Tax=Junco hyemalis TaxID=40217 RepID=A0A8C5IG83_JUNHY